MNDWILMRFFGRMQKKAELSYEYAIFVLDFYCAIKLTVDLAPRRSFSFEIQSRDLWDFHFLMSLLSRFSCAKTPVL